MSDLSKISSSGQRLRLPVPFYGIDVNFCRNPQCDLFMEPPDPVDRRGQKNFKVKPNLPRGEVIGSGDDKSFKCGACGKSSIIKNNKAIVEEYRRLRGQYHNLPERDACPNIECANHGKSRSKNPDLYRKTGKTTKGDQRWKCTSCARTFSTGSSVRRQKASHHNHTVLWMLTNGLPISKIGEYTGLAPKDIYRKIDFIYERVLDITSHREGCFEDVDWARVGRRFATDSQTLHLNWPNKKTRAQIAVHHLCTAHANSGYIMAAHIGLDPDVELPDIEAYMEEVDDFRKPRCFREQARLWSETEFKFYLDKITRCIEIHPLEAPEVDLGLQLPHSGALIRQDIIQLAHAFLIRKFLGKSGDNFVFNLDADSGLALSFISAFASWIKNGQADVITVQFDKHLSNDQRNCLVAEGKTALELATGISRGQWANLSADEANRTTDAVIFELLEGRPPATPFLWPFHSKSEPDRCVSLLTDHANMDPDRRARLMRLATLRSVDSYFHKVRSNLRFAARGSSTPSGNGQTWDRHYLYNPQTMIKLIEIYRFTHNWMGKPNAKKEKTPAMKLGLAKGKIYPRDLFA